MFKCFNNDICWFLLIAERTVLCLKLWLMLQIESVWDMYHHKQLHCYHILFNGRGWNSTMLLQNNIGFGFKTSIFLFWRWILASSQIIQYHLSRINPLKGGNGLAECPDGLWRLHWRINQKKDSKKILNPISTLFVIFYVK